MRTKILKLILPYFVFSIGFLTIYSLLHWLLVTYLDLIKISFSLVVFWLPIIISGVFVLVFLRQRLKLCSDKLDKDFPILVIFFVFLALPVATFQYYLMESNSLLTSVSIPSEIREYNPTRYYSISNSKINKQIKGDFVSFTSVNRGVEKLVNCTFVSPIGDSSSMNNILDMWIGVTFSKKYSNRVFDNKEKQNKLVADFVDSCYIVYNDYAFQTKYLRRMENKGKPSNYIKAIKTTKLDINLEKIIILIEESSSYENRAGQSKKWTIGSLIISNLVWIFLVMTAKKKGV